MRLVSIALALALCGCASTRSVVSIYAEHVSHASQHLGSERTNFGYESLDAALTVERPNGLGPYVTVAEGYNFGSPWQIQYEEFGVPDEARGFGALEGPREVFSMRIGFRFRAW